MLLLGLFSVLLGLSSVQYCGCFDGPFVLERTLTCRNASFSSVYCDLRVQINSVFLPRSARLPVFCVRIRHHIQQLHQCLVDRCLGASPDSSSYTPVSGEG